jgi:hypothetical protein
MPRATRSRAKQAPICLTCFVNSSLRMALWDTFMNYKTCFMIIANDISSIFACKEGFCNSPVMIPGKFVWFGSQTSLYPSPIVRKQLSKT